MEASNEYLESVVSGWRSSHTFHNDWLKRNHVGIKSLKIHSSRPVVKHSWGFRDEFTLPGRMATEFTVVSDTFDITQFNWVQTDITHSRFVLIDPVLLCLPNLTACEIIQTKNALSGVTFTMVPDYGCYNATSLSGRHLGKLTEKGLADIAPALGVLNLATREIEPSVPADEFDNVVCVNSFKPRSICCDNVEV